MAARRDILVVIAIILVTLLLGVAGVCTLRQARARHQEPAVDPGRFGGVEVEVAPAVLRQVTPEVSASGFLEPFEQITVSTEVAGYLAAQHVEVSDRIAEGDTLFELDTSLREAAVKKAHAAVDRARTDLQFAAENVDRIQRLETQASTNATEVLQARTDLAVAEAVLKQAETALEEAMILLDKAVIRSPLTGSISKVHRRRGEYAHIGQPLVEIIETDRLKLLVQLNDRETVVFTAGGRVTMRVPALPSDAVHGTVLRIHPTASPDSRKFVVEIEVPNVAGRLRPGFYAEAKITRRSPNDDASGGRVLAIPRMAVVELHRRQYCYVARHVNGEKWERAIRVPIETAPILSDPYLLAVLSGVKQGDRVITTGLQHVQHNSIVRIPE